jgi:hypothetical protein
MPPDTFLHERSDFKALVATVAENERINEREVPPLSSKVRPKPEFRFHHSSRDLVRLAPR